MEATAVRERPILFSAPMVRAILAGTKTQTRRIVKPQSLFDGKDAIVKRHPNQEGCKYGETGMRLWVRETWQRLSNGSESEHHPAYQGTHDVFYRADESDPESRPLSGKWRPSIFMPRWASRILLEITEVRVQRLQEISEEDAAAEGCTGWYSPSVEGNTDGCMPSEEYAALWDQINGAGSWESNPWVWAVSFKRLEPTHA